MPDLPMMMKLKGRRCLIVGGGAVALRRAKVLLAAEATVTVIAPQVDPELHTITVTIHTRPFEPSDLDDTFLVVTATSDPSLNAKVAALAAERRVLVNRADDAPEGDFVIPAHRHQGPLTLAVHSGGVSASAAGQIRDQLLGSLDSDWIRLLETIAPYRRRLRNLIEDSKERQVVLRQLASSPMMDILKAGGEQALLEACDDLLERYERAADRGDSGIREDEKLDEPMS